MSKKIKFIIVGVGNIGSLHAGVLSKIHDAQIVAVVEGIEDRAKVAAEKFSCKYYLNVDEAIADCQFDAAAICTPSAFHSEPAIKLLKAGKHVVVEKPIDIKMERVLEMEAAATLSGATIFPIFQVRFVDSVLTTDKLIADGKLGNVFYVGAHVKWFRDQAYFDESKWRGTWAIDGGGALMNQAIHYVDLLCHFGGAIQELYGKCGTFAHPTIETEDIGVATIKFKNGGIGLLEGTTAAYPGLSARLDIYGDKGTIIIENQNIVKFASTEMSEDECSKYVETAQMKTGAGKATNIEDKFHKRQYEDIIASLLENRPAKVTIADAKAALGTILGVYQSSQTGEIVKF